MTEEHYYTKNPTIDHDEKMWSFSMFQHNLTFTTDAGVFSRQTIDFGTRTMLENFNYEHLPVGKILDLGAGYGPVAISLAKILPDRKFDAVEINERAAALIQKNAMKNQVANQIKVIQSDQYANVTDQYAAILTNPPVRAGKEVVNGMLVKAIDHLVIGGTLTVVLQKKQGAPSAKKTMEAVFGNVQTIAKNKGYYILESTRNQ